MNNPIDFIKAIKDPKSFVLNAASTNTNPMLKSLVEMAEKGDTKGVEEFARNMFKEQGKDFDQEFNNFKSMFNGK